MPKHDIKFLLVTIGVIITLAQPSRASDDWPVWRGPTKDGIASPGQQPPVHWDDRTNVRWKSKIPGRGHSSPIIVGQRIFLTTCQEAKGTQSVLCFSRESGDLLWQTTICTGNLSPQIHPNNTHASQTIVATQDRLFANFWNNDQVELASLDHDGNLIWQKTVGDFLPKYPFGYGASPCLFDDLVIVSLECEKIGALVAFHQKDGKERWRTPRDRGTGYSSPIVHRVAGRDQLLISGSWSVRSYDPKDGQPLWSVEGPWEVTCGTMVSTALDLYVGWPAPSIPITVDLVFASGGYPRGKTLAIRASGEVELLWSNRVKSYEQSLLVNGGFVYGVSDRGVVYCWDAVTGQERWKQRLAGPISASPVMAGGNIYITTERGKTFVFQASPEKYIPVAENQLGQSSFASLTMVNSRIYARVGFQDKGQASQWLYCLAQ